MGRLGWCIGLDPPNMYTHSQNAQPPPGLAMQMLREALLLHDDHRFRVADHCVKRLEVRFGGKGGVCCL